MQLSLDTYCKTEGRPSREIGRSTVEVSAGGFRALESLEEKLRASEQQELYADADEASITLELPEAIDSLTDCQVRVFLGGEEQAAHFHLVGREANEGSLVYTNPVMVRMVAV